MTLKLAAEFRMHARLLKINKQMMYRYFIFQLFSVQNILTEQRRSNTVNNCGRKSKYKYPFCKTETVKKFNSCASFVTVIFAVNFDWSIKSCDKAPRDLNYERNTEKYGRAMKLAITRPSFCKSPIQNFWA